MFSSSLILLSFLKSMLLHVIDIAHVSAKFTGLCPAAGTGKVERLPLKPKTGLSGATSSKNCVLILINKDLANLILKTKDLFHLILKIQGSDLGASVQGTKDQGPGTRDQKNERRSFGAAPLNFALYFQDNRSGKFRCMFCQLYFPWNQQVAEFAS